MADIEQIKSKLDIVSVVSEYVELKPAGSNFRGLCPFHSEKSPSFMVNPSLQIYKCFGCGNGGDVIKFYQEIERLDFRDALQKAAEKAGVEIDSFSPKDKKTEATKKRIFLANELAAKFYNHILKTHKNGISGREYAAKRNIESAQINKFMFGFAPNNHENLKKFLLSRGFSEDELLEFGLLIDRNGKKIDKFRNRLLQPIFTLDGNIAGFSGRYIGNFDKAPKYLNSSDSLVYRKNEILYGLYQAKEAIRKKGFVILVEGNLDVVTVSKNGDENVVAPLGTAFTPAQAKLLKRFTDTIYFCFDSDTAGVNAVIRSVKIAEDENLKHLVIDLDDFQDSDDLINKNPKLWNKKLQNPIDTIDYLKAEFAEGLDLGTAAGKKTFQSKILPILSFIKDKVSRTHYLKDISIILEVSQDDLENLLNNGVKIPLQIADPAPQASKPDKVELDSENLILANIIQAQKNICIKIDKEFWEDKILEQLHEILYETNSKIDKEVLETLDPEVLNKYKELFVANIKYKIETKEDLKKYYNRVYLNKLKQKILHLRKEIAVNEDDDKKINELQKLIIRLKKLSTN